MARPTKQTRPAVKPERSEQPETLDVAEIVAAINDGGGDPHLVAVLNQAIYQAGAQDPSMELPRSWQRVQRRLRVEADGFATAEQVVEFARHAGLGISL